MADVAEDRGKTRIDTTPLIKALICKIGEYWYYGSLCDDWHPEKDTQTIYLFVGLDEQSKNVACEEVTGATIQNNLKNSGWMRNLIVNALLPCGEIVESYHYCWEDEKEPEEDTMYYSRKGIMLYSCRPKESGWPRHRLGTDLPKGWTEMHEVYLLETGQIAIVKRRSFEYCRKVSFFHDESGKDVYTKMEIWEPDEIEKERERIAKELIKMIESPTDHNGNSPKEE